MSSIDKLYNDARQGMIDEVEELIKLAPDLQAEALMYYGRKLYATVHSEISVAERAERIAGADAGLDTVAERLRVVRSAVEEWCASRFETSVKG